jgi:hypothetical protein
LVKARVLNFGGAAILVCADASFFAAAAGSGSLQLTERSALLMYVLEVILEGLESWKAWKAFARALVGNLTSVFVTPLHPLLREATDFNFFYSRQRKKYNKNFVLWFCGILLCIL